jgi:hypothetical protein
VASALFTVLGQVGDAIAKGKESNRQDADAQALLQDQLKTTALNRVLSRKRLGLEQSRLDAAELTRQLALRRFEFDQEQAHANTPAGQRARVEQALGRKMTDEETERLFKIAPPSSAASPYELKLDNNRELVWMPKDPRSGLKPIKSGVRGPVPSSNNFPSGPTTVEGYAESVRRGDITLPQVPQKLRGDVIKYMQGHGETPGRKRTAQEIQQIHAINKVKPVVARLRELIEARKMQGVNGYGDILTAQKNWQLYSHGKKPAEPYASMIKDAAALRIMGAAPWVSIGRGRYLFDEIQKHLPNPAWDTPAQLYDKMQFLQGILQDAETDLHSDEQGVGPSDIGTLPPP